MAPEIIAVLSPARGTGGSIVALNLAFALESHGYKVLLVDAVLSNPSIAKLLGIRPPEFGFAEILAGSVSAKKAITQYRNTKLDLVLGAYNAAEIKLTYRHIIELLLNGRKLLSYDFIVSDGPSPAPPPKRFPVPYNVLLVSTPEQSLVEKTIFGMKMQYISLGISTNLIVNMQKKTLKKWKSKFYGQVTDVLPHESKMKSYEKNKIPAFLANRDSAFSKGIDALAAMYIRKKFGEPGK